MDERINKLVMKNEGVVKIREEDDAKRRAQEALEGVQKTALAKRAEAAIQQLLDRMEAIVAAFNARSTAGSIQGRSEMGGKWVFTLPNCVTLSLDSETHASTHKIRDKTCQIAAALMGGRRAIHFLFLEDEGTGDRNWVAARVKQSPYNQKAESRPEPFLESVATIAFVSSHTNDRFMVVFSDDIDAAIMDMIDFGLSPVTPREVPR